jgi:two-component system, OmpR family, response regulator
MLVEDDYLLNKTIANYLKGCGFGVDSFHDGDEAYAAITNAYDLFVLDIDIPSVNGIELLEKIRLVCPDTPSIMISATIELNMIVKAYGIGCADYMKKPFDVKELELKIMAISTKTGGKIELQDGLTYDRTTRALSYRDEEILLTANEKKLLHLLVANHGKTVTPEQIAYAVWGDEDSGHIRQLVGRLKKKIPVNLIENRQGSGYIIK